MEAIEVVKEFVEERREVLKNLDKILRRMVKKAKRILGEETKVYLFGSYVKGDFHQFLSDIDILIVSDQLEGMPMFKRAKILLTIKEGLRAGYMFEIHLVTKKEFEWYKFFIDKFVEIK